MHRSVIALSFCFLIWRIRILLCTCAQSCPAPCDSTESGLPPGSSVHGILQARILEWVAISSSRGSSWPRDWTCGSFSSYISKWILLLLSHQGSSLLCETYSYTLFDLRFVESMCFYLKKIIQVKIMLCIPIKKNPTRSSITMGWI